MKISIAMIFDKYSIRLLFLVFLFNFIGVPSSDAQNADPSGLSVPNSAGDNSAGLANSSAVNVSLYSGIPNVSVPLHPVKGDQIALPLALSYNGSGVRVGAVSSWVGLNWNLHAGGAIVRQMNGLPDDCYSTYNAPVSETFYNVGFFYTGGVVETMHAKSIDQISTGEQALVFSGKFDLEPDVYSFNFGAYSGTFFLDKNKEIQLESQSDLKIEYDHVDYASPINDHSFLTTPYFRGMFKSFTITTPDGVKYHFDQREYAIQREVAPFNVSYDVPEHSDCEPLVSNTPYEVEFDNQPAYVAAWYLSSITNPLGAKEFTFTYEDEISFDQSTFVNWIYKPCPANPVVSKVYNGKSILNTFISKRLSQISFGNGHTSTYGTIDFTAYVNRDDLYQPSNNSGLSKPKALTRIVYRTGNTFARRFEFTYGWYNEKSLGCSTYPAYVTAHRKRLKLESVQEYGVAVAMPPYTFTYDNTPLPPRHSASIDFWGYYNNKNNDGAMAFIPTQHGYPEDVATNNVLKSIFSSFPRPNAVGLGATFPGADQTPDPQYAKAGILTAIKNPTGGTIDLSYEGNVFQMYNSTVEKTGGGVRLKQMTSNDQNGNSQTVNYFYDDAGDGTGATTGKLTEMPTFHHLRDKGVCEDFSPTGSGIANYLSQVIMQTSLNRSAENPFSVAYAEVYEVRSTGKILNQFYLPVYYGVNSHNIYKRGVSEYWPGSAPYYPEHFPFPANPNYNWRNVLPLKQSIYNAAGKLVKKVVNTYTLKKNSKIYGIRGLSGLDTEETTTLKWGKYFRLSTFNPLTKTIVYDYSFNDKRMTTATHVEYNSADHKFPTAQWTKNSDGKVFRTEYKYAPDIGDTELINANRIGTPVEVISKVDGLTTGGSKISFRNFVVQCGLGCSGGNFSIYNPEKSYSLEGANWVLKKTILEYSYQGFVTEQQLPGQTPSSYSYDTYNGKLRFKYWNNWQWTYEYNAKNELDLVINPDLQETEYFYDDLHRIEKISKRNGDHLTEYDYHLNLNAGGQNYTETAQTITGLTNLPTENNYYDGFGRSIKTTFNNYTPTGGAYTQSVTYDANGRMINSCDPASGGCSTNTYENSIISRSNTRQAPSWSNQVISRTYFNTTADAVKTISGGTYAKFTLVKSQFIDENGKVFFKFTDKMGRLILERKILSSSPHADTYYYYDDKGQLTHVLPPGVSSITSDLAFKYVYYDNGKLSFKYIPDQGWYAYEYYPGSLFPKKETDPAGDVIQYEYNQYNQITFIKDGSGSILQQFVYGASNDINKGRLLQKYVKNLDNGQLLLTTYTYDAYGRVKTELADNHLGGNDFYVYHYDMADRIQTIHRGHTGSVGNSKTIKKRYEYDDAGRLTGVFMTVDLGTEIQLSALKYDAKDRLIEKNLGVTGSSYLQSVDYQYNGRGWLSKINQFYSSSIEPCVGIGGLSAGGYDEGIEAQVALSFTYSPEALAKGFSSEIDVYYTAEFFVGEENLGGESEQFSLKVEGTGDFAESQLISESLYLSGTVTFESMAEAMANSIRNTVNNEFVLLGKGHDPITSEEAEEIANLFIGAAQAASGPTPPPLIENDLFAEEIFYDVGNTALGATAQYNGNIAQVHWQVATRDIEQYGFSYDDLDRLKNTKYRAYDAEDCSYYNLNRYRVAVSYADQRGNIKRIQRWGKRANSYGKIDDVSMTYEADKNRIHTITESNNKSYGFKGNTGTVTYDNKGNLKSDPSRGITNVSYNFLNLPTSISVDNTNFYGNITMKYDAEGNLLYRLVTQVSPAAPSIRIDYIAGIEYLNDEIESIYHEEGRYVKQGTVWNHEYVLKDHLGNSRVFFSDKDGNGYIARTPTYGEVTQEAHYYPFGMQMRGTGWYTASPPKSPYLYNGIEHVDNLGLNINMAFYRVNDPALGRWWQVDPKGELMYGHSLYNGMNNNPILYNDPNGDIAPLVLAGAALVGATFNVWQNWDHITESGSVNWGNFAAAAGIGAVAAGVSAIAAPVAGPVTTLWATVSSSAYGWGIAGAVGGAIQGAGNGAYFHDGNLRDRLLNGLGQGVKGGVLGGFIGAGLGAAFGAARFGIHALLAKPPGTIEHSPPGTGRKTSNGDNWSSKASGGGEVVKSGGAVDDVAFSVELDDAVVVSAPRIDSQTRYTFTKSAAKHFNDIVTQNGWLNGNASRPYMNSPLTIKEIMATGKGIPDATAKGALNFRVPGTFRGSQGTWELVIDPIKNHIYHFNFVN